MKLPSLNALIHVLMLAAAERAKTTITTAGTKQQQLLNVVIHF